MIFVDVREERSRVPNLLRKMRVPTQSLELEVGDYIVGEVCVERKAINDYIGSLSSGHLANQLYQMSYNFELSYLIVEGLVSEALIYRKMRRAPFISSLVGSSLKRAPDGKQGQIVTVNLENPWDSALFLRFLHDKVVKGEARLPRMKKVKANPDEVMVYVLSSFPNIGEKRAKKLLEHYKTLRGVFVSEFWENSKAVGPKTNLKVQGLLERSYGGE